MCIQLWKSGIHPTACSGLHGEGKRREAHCFFTWGSSSASEGNLMPQRPYEQFLSLYLNVTKKTENLFWSVSWFQNPLCLGPGWKDQRTQSWSISVLLLRSSWFQGLPGLGAFFLSRSKWSGIFSVHALCEKYAWALPMQTRQKCPKHRWHHSETSDKWPLHVTSATHFRGLSSFVITQTDPGPVCAFVLLVVRNLAVKTSWVAVWPSQIWKRSLAPPYKN